MGLGQGEVYPRPGLAWRFPGVLAAVSIGLAAGGGGVREALEYRRAAIADGEVYRLLTGHFVHLDWPHLLLNVAGLLLVWALVGGVFSTRQWSAVLAGAVAAIDLGFWYGLPGLDWYVGQSGVLHGLLAAGIVGLWERRRGEAALLGAVLAGKLAWEGLAGGMPGSSALVAGDVITEAHLFGAIGGGIAALILSVIARRPQVTIKEQQ